MLISLKLIVLASLATAARDETVAGTCSVEDFGRPKLNEVSSCGAPKTETVFGGAAATGAVVLDVAGDRGWISFTTSNPIYETHLEGMLQSFVDRTQAHISLPR